MSESHKLHLGRDHARDLLRDMRLIRRFEETCAELYTQQKIRGFLHLYLGEEANAVGVLHALAPDDAVVATYREHGHALIRGVPPGPLMAEMFGKSGGCCRGRGGSMHVFDIERRFYGGNAIVAGGLPLAVGLALADRMLQRPRVTCCFFGDGAVAEGVFHESLNLAALWRLPVLFVCENNLYAMGTAIERALAEPEIQRHAERYRIPAEVVDGMDVIAVEAAARRAVDAIRDDGGPRLLESKTYRFCAHSMFDAELYRDRTEVERWRARDPLPRFRDFLLGNGYLHADEDAAIDAGIETLLDEAVAFAEDSPWEPVDTLLEHVMTPPAAGGRP